MSDGSHFSQHVTSLFGNPQVSSHLRNVTLESVLAGGTCSPIGLADFEAYLSFMERSLENLQFVVWYQSYKQRHLAQPDLSCAPSPVAATTAPSSSTGSDPSKPTSFGQRIALSIDTRSLGHSTTPTTKSDTGRTCFNDPLRSSDTLVTPTNSGTAPWLSPRLKEDHYDDQAMPATSFVATPTSLQAQDPFRDECERIVATFFSPSSRKELSLDSDTRDGVLHNLTRSTHPDVFSPAYDAIFYTLQTYSLPRFFACASAATNRPNQIFWFAWGITCLCISLVIYVTTLVFAPWDDFRSRALRLICVFPAMMGTSFPYAAAQGYCLNVSGRRKNMQLRPWELEALGAATREWWIGIISPIVVPNANQEQLGPDLEVAENRDANSGEPADSSQSSAVLPARLARIAARRARERREAMLADVAIIAPFVGDTILHQDSPSRLVYSEGAGPAPITISFTRQTETYVTEDHHAPPSITGNKDSIVNFEIDDNSMTRESTAVSLSGKNPASLVYDTPSRIRNRWRHRTGQNTIDTSFRIPPIFGPEKVVLDPRIMAVHQATKRKVLTIQISTFIISTILCLAVPVVR